MPDKIAESHTSMQSRGSSFFIENLLGSDRTEPPPVCPVKHIRDGEGLRETIHTPVYQQHQEACHEESSTHSRMEMCRKGSPSLWYGRDSLNLGTLETSDSE